MFLSHSRTLLGSGCAIAWIDLIQHDKGQKKCIYQYIFIKSII